MYTLGLSLWQRLMEWDRSLFLKINGQWTSSTLDVLVPFLRNAMFWIPLYILILVFVLLNFGKKGIFWSLAFICTVALTDSLGAQLLKEAFGRTRPCNDPGMIFHVRLLLKSCPTSYSFVSNHAANHFGMATFMFLTFKGIFKKWTSLIFLWAFVIGYAQIYVGVHYPLDIIGGAAFGILTGVLTAWLFHKNWGIFSLDHQS
ncbi:MAG: phosphatase PAP2 family protein [Flavisolibacter sp.]